MDNFENDENPIRMRASDTENAASAYGYVDGFIGRPQRATDKIPFGKLDAYLDGYEQGKSEAANLKNGEYLIRMSRTAAERSTNNMASSAGYADGYSGRPRRADDGIPYGRLGAYRSGYEQGRAEAADV